MFSHHYHIRPWEMDLLTVDQFDNLVEAYDRLVKESKESADG